MRQFNWLDKLLLNAEQGLRTLSGHYMPATRPNPGATRPEPLLGTPSTRHALGLMRVNHAGEVAAQGLYQGQALTARLPSAAAAMEQAAREENDHLVWCQQRVRELGGQVSHLTPLWYGGAFVVGALAGIAGDRWSLGFVAETEHQVVKHLDQHLNSLPPHDDKSHAILAQMRIDERQHATNAQQAGGQPLPVPIKKLMQLTAKVMTTTAYYL